MKNIIRSLMLGMAFNLLVFSLHAISVTQKRVMPSFNSVTNESPLKISYAQSNEYKVFINMEERLVQGLKTEVRDDMLYISLDEMLVPNKDEKYVILVYAPVLVEAHNAGLGGLSLGDLTGTLLLIDNSGGGSVDFAFARYNAVDAYTSIHVNNRGNGSVTGECYVNELKIENKGAGAVELKGSTQELKISCVGVGNVDALELTAQRAIVSLVGTGRIVATVTGIAKVQRRGHGVVNIFGDATIIQE